MKEWNLDEPGGAPPGIDSTPSAGLLQMYWGPPPVRLNWNGYRDELEKAGVPLPSNRDCEFAWINVQWREPRADRENLVRRFEFDRFPGLIDGLADRLVGKGCLQVTHLYARFPPADEIRVINSRWLAWMLIGKSTGHLWSRRCSVNTGRLSWFAPSDIAEGIHGLCWHGALYIRRDRLESLVREAHTWEKENESEIKDF